MKHPNRNAKNWLLYNIGDRFLLKNAMYFKGALYDFGCGEKPNEKLFLKYVDQYIGVDWGETQHLLKADIIADLNKPLPIEDEVADTIVSLSVMEHLCEPQMMLNEAFRILKKDGTIVLQVPWQWWLHELPHDYFRFTPSGLRYMFQKAGFSEMIIEAQSGFFTTWIVKFNYFSARFVHGSFLRRRLLTVTLTPFWFFGQLIAPYLDKLDRNWELESQGYFVIARKL